MHANPAAKRRAIQMDPCVLLIYSYGYRGLLQICDFNGRQRHSHSVQPLEHKKVGLRFFIVFYCFFFPAAVPHTITNQPEHLQTPSDAQNPLQNQVPTSTSTIGRTPHPPVAPQRERFARHREHTTPRGLQLTNSKRAGADQWRASLDFAALFFFLAPLFSSLLLLSSS